MRITADIISFQMYDYCREVPLYGMLEPVTQIQTSLAASMQNDKLSVLYPEMEAVRVFGRFDVLVTAR